MPDLGVVQKVVEQILQPLTLAMDQADPLGGATLGWRRRFLLVLGFHVFSQQFHVEPDGGERVADFVGQRPR